MKNIPMAFFVVIVCAKSWNSHKAPLSRDSSKGGGMAGNGREKIPL